MRQFLLDENDNEEIYLEYLDIIEEIKEVYEEDHEADEEDRDADIEDHEADLDPDRFPTSKLIYTMVIIGIFLLGLTLIYY